MRKRKKKPLEKDLVNDVIKPWLVMLGYTIIVKTHGNRYQKKGLPDLYCYGHGAHRWLEAKRPDGKLEASQIKLFSEWEAKGLHVDVVTVIDGKVEISPWREWL